MIEEPRFGDVIHPDGWRGMFTKLEPNECAGIPYRVEMPNYKGVTTSIDVVITGRRVHYDSSGYPKIRVKIIWINEDVPNEVSHGWLTRAPRF